MGTLQHASIRYWRARFDRLAPGLGRIVGGLKDGDVGIAKEYLKGQIRARWPSDFLTSNLMPYLAIRDGVEPGMQKAAL